MAVKRKLIFRSMVFIWVQRNALFTMHTIIFFKEILTLYPSPTPPPKHKYWKEEIFKFGENIIQNLWEPFEKSPRVNNQRTQQHCGQEVFLPFQTGAKWNLMWFISFRIWHLTTTWSVAGWCQCTPHVSKHQLLLSLKIHLRNKYLCSVYYFRQ